MQWNADIFLALRYLRPRRSFISVITLLSVLGPVLGVALLVIVTAVMSGFDHDIRNRILGMQAHLQVFPPPALDGSRGTIEDPGPILATLRRLGARGAPLIEGPVLVQWRNHVMIKYVKGIVPGLERGVSSLPRHVRGRFDLREGEALIGAEMAARYGIRIGDRLLIHSPARLTQNIRWGRNGKITLKNPEEVYLPEEATVVGIFSMGLYEYDASLVFIHLDQAAELFGLDWGAATSVQARVPDPFHMDELERAVRKALPGYRVLTWKEANRQLFGALRVEKNMMSFLLFFIVLVAAFGISGTLITVVVQKTREIGILKAVGMSGWTVARIFLLQGAIIGTVGAAAGTGAGLLVVRYRDRVAAFFSRVMGVNVFPPQLYHLSGIPAQVRPGDVSVIAGLALLLCIAGALIPAVYASLLSPAVALSDDN